MITTPLFLEFEDLRQKCRWFLLLGIVMLVLGTVAFIIAPAATIGTMINATVPRFPGGPLLEKETKPPSREIQFATPSAARA